MMADKDDFQARSGREGRQAQAIAASVLEGAGFNILQANYAEPKTKVTVNILAADQVDREWLFDVSGSFTSSRAGLMRTDTMWKTLGRANVLSAAGFNRLILLTTNLPPKGSVGAHALGLASDTYFDAVEMMTAEGKQRLRQYAAGSRLVPLPGFHLPERIYPGLQRSAGTNLATIAVPLAELDDPVLTRRSTRYDVREAPFRVKVFVPTKDSDGRDIPLGTRRRAGKDILEILNRHAGGSTGMEAIGSWIDPIGGVMHEAVSVVEAWASEPFPTSDVEDLVELVLGDLRQHTAALVVNDRMVLIEHRST